MKERPILFSTPMVQATIELRKTKTRRVKGLEIINEMPDDWKFIDVLAGSYKDKASDVFRFVNSKNAPVNIACPYGKPGDVLWVRETWGFYNGNGIFGGDFTAPSKREGKIGWKESVVHKAGTEKNAWGMYGKPKWKPSIFMPRSACRIFLEVVSVRVERLQDITRGDAMSEGCPFPNMANGDNPVDWFSNLWQSINGKNSWNENPWVWVVEFKRINHA